MLKMMVRPLAIKNSNMPNRTPLRVDMTISSSTTHRLRSESGVRRGKRRDERNGRRKDQLGRSILQVVGKTVSGASTFPTPFQPQPVFSSSNGSLFLSSPNDEMYIGWKN